MQKARFRISVLHNSIESIIYGVAMQDALHNNIKYTSSKEIRGWKIHCSSEYIQLCILAAVFWEIQYRNRQTTKCFV